MTMKTGRRFRTVLGYDIKESLVDSAEREGIIDTAAGSEADLIRRTQVVVLAVPINVILTILERYCHALISKALVVDLGSVRGPIQKVSSRLKMRNHVGVHPVCGTALRGRSAWNAKLFMRASCFVFSNPSTDENSILRAVKLIRLIGGKAVTIDYRKHDYAFAVTSGLPHVFAYSLMKVRSNSRGIPNELEGPSFAAATRVSASDPVMTAEILYSNRDYLLRAISRLERNVYRIKKLLSRGDSKKLARALESYGQTSCRHDKAARR